ncbi:MAG: hypothetical protein NVSMB9_28530 [Isosphaeraceae bacterium]
MPATTLPGLGTLLQLKIAGIFTTIGERVELDGPDTTLGIRDTTHLDSPYKAKRPTITDLGKLSGKCFFDPNDLTTHTIVRNKVFAAPSAPDLYQLVYNDSKTTTHATDAFSGFLVKFKPTGMKVDDSLQFEFELELTDAFTATQGS